MSSSDSDFVSHPRLFKKRRISRASAKAYIEEELHFSSDEQRKQVILSDFSDSSEQENYTPNGGQGSRPSVSFDIGVTQLLSDSYDYIENITLAERISEKRDHNDNQCRNQDTVKYLFGEGSSSDFSGFGDREIESDAIVTGVTYAEIHNEKYTQLTQDSNSEKALQQCVYDNSSLKDFNNIFSLYEHITSTEEKCLVFLKNNKLIPLDDTPCPKCKTKCSKRKGVLKYRLCKEKDRKCNLRLICSGGGGCKYRVSPFTGTFFDGSTCRLPLQKVLQIIYFFLHQYRLCDARRENEVSENTITDYYNYCREVCAVSLTSENCVLGGPGEVVEIDESKFFKRKYNKGRVLSAQQEGWVFGGIQRSTKECFMVRVKDRSKETLLPLIRKYIKPGTTIISDEWKAYSQLQQHGYQHNTVCHKVNFVNPQNKEVHTQNIENSWRYAKNTYPERYTSEQLRDSYLQEFLYRRKHKDNLIPQFFKDITKIYKHPAM